MRGGVPFITLPAGYLGSSFIGACCIACVSKLNYTRFIGHGRLTFKGFDTNASKVACLVLCTFFLLTLFWARKSWIAWCTILFAASLIVVSTHGQVGCDHVSRLLTSALQVAWLVYHSIALRFLVLFLGVMSCLYCIVSEPQRQELTHSGTLLT